MAIISRGHKHGCLLKTTDSFSVITALGGDSLMEAPVISVRKWQKLKYSSDDVRGFFPQSRSVGLCFAFFRSGPC